MTILHPKFQQITVDLIFFKCNIIYVLVMKSTTTVTYNTTCFSFEQTIYGMLHIMEKNRGDNDNLDILSI